MGGCFCGAVRYRIDAAPVEVSHCHCGICRRTSGAPFVTWATVPAAAFAFTRGAPDGAALDAAGGAAACARPAARRSRFARRARPEWIDVTVGSLDDPNAVRAGRTHLDRPARCDWLRIDDDLPRHPEQGPSG